jgi:hypothetical protein
MAYTNFKKLDQLEKAFGIDVIQSSWLPKTFQPVSVSDILMVNLKDAQLESLRTEKAKSEYVIAPVLI